MTLFPASLSLQSTPKAHRYPPQGRRRGSPPPRFQRSSRDRLTVGCFDLPLLLLLLQLPLSLPSFLSLRRRRRRIREMLRIQSRDPNDRSSWFVVAVVMPALILSCSERLASIFAAGGENVNLDGGNDLCFALGQWHKKLGHQVISRLIL